MKAHVILGLIQKYWYITLNSLDRVFDLFYWPLIGLFIWGFTTFYLRDIVGESIIYIFLGGTVLWIFFQRAAQDISVFILEDFWSHNLFNLFATPLKTSELVVSIVIPVEATSHAKALAESSQNAILSASGSTRDSKPR